MSRLDADKVWLLFTKKKKSPLTRGLGQLGECFPPNLFRGQRAMMHIPESSRGEAFHPLFVTAPSCQQSASHLSHSRVRLRRSFQNRSNDGSKGRKCCLYTRYWGKWLLASHANSALSRGIIDPDTLLRAVIREPASRGWAGTWVPLAGSDLSRWDISHW